MPQPEDLLSVAVAGLGGARREGQVAMCTAVARAMATSRHLAVQAGTGTGKSLAYLVPAICHAQETGETVVVSTATIALQRQLVERDLPRLADALEDHLERRPTFALQKGRAHYVCLRKINGAPEAPLGDGAGAQESLGGETLGPLAREVKRVHEWAATSPTGDREDLVPGVSQTVWRSVSVTSQECMGFRRCPFGDQCFAQRALFRAKDADIVVTNHALLAVDSVKDAGILPQHSVVVVDEAHELDGQVTSMSTATVAPSAISRLAERIKKWDAQAPTEALGLASAEWQGTAGELSEGRWTSLNAAASSRLVQLRDALAKLRRFLADAPEGEQANDPDRFAERMTFVRSLQQPEESIQRILDVFAESDPAAREDVVWLERRSQEPVISVAPISISEVLQDHLFEENTVVLTSATLALGGRFEPMAQQWGLPEGTWDALDVGTPFQPRRSGILYSAAHLPPPGRGGLSEELVAEAAGLIEAAGGRTLGLFSSRRAAEDAAEALRELLPFPILLQGEDTLGALVQRFHDDEAACLFGTLSLWQGVDVPGRTLSQVLIDRIPFPRPDDPLTAARSDAAKASGRNAFMEVSVHHAALLLAQGAGRLIRSTSDRGVVAVLDSRLSTRRYGSFLLRSMPPFWLTTDGGTVRGALRRLVSAPEAKAEER